jgi:hypothetical protein
VSPRASLVRVLVTIRPKFNAHPLSSLSSTVRRGADLLPVAERFHFASGASCTLDEPVTRWRNNPRELTFAAAGWRCGRSAVHDEMASTHALTAVHTPSQLAPANSAVRIWEQEVAGSNPVAPIDKNVKRIKHLASTVQSGLFADLDVRKHTGSKWAALSFFLDTCAHI